MPVVTVRQLLDHAAENNYAIPAFNVNNLEQLHAIFMAARKTQSPVIIQYSRGARGYIIKDAFMRRVIEGAAEEYPEIPFAIHQDHGDTPATCFTAIQAGFTSVMMDGSIVDGKPASFEYNVQVTKEVVNVAHKVGVSVEGELGVLGSLESGHGEKEDGHGVDGAIDHSLLLTDVAEAVEFVKLTGVDSLAVAIGTSHGAYKFTSKPTGDVLAINRVKEINQALPNTHLVMHGASSVPQDLQDRLNAAGGKMKQTFGTPVSEIQKAIKFGVRKVNVDTDLRMAFTAAIREIFQTNPGEFDLRKYLKPAMDSMQVVCEQRYNEFGAAGHSSKIKSKSLTEMRAYYTKK